MNFGLDFNLASTSVEVSKSKHKSNKVSPSPCRVELAQVKVESIWSRPKSSRVDSDQSRAKSTQVKVESSKP